MSRSKALLPLTVLTLLPATAWAAPDAFTAALSRGPAYAALAALAGGFAVSLTPCVYPMVAVTVSVFGARQAKHRYEGVLLSLAFVAGIVAMFVPLGVAAGLTGTMFGSVLQNRWIVVGMAALFLLLAASLFGAFELTLPPALTNRLAQMGGIGYKGAFLLGLACGLIATPCTGPVLGGILVWIAKTQSAALGALAMGSFALGLGVPFFAVGAFAMQLPKSGRWMVHVKSALGIVLVVVALHFLNTAFPIASGLASKHPGFIAGAVAAVVLGLLLGAVHREFADGGTGVKFAKGAGIALCSFGGFFAILGATKPAPALSWEATTVDAARERAAREKRPLVIDFTAEWCGACKQLERHTFSEPRVGQELGRFVAVRVDATNNDDPHVEATLSRFNVVGLPTVVLFDSEGREAARLNDFVPAEEFLRLAQRVN